MEGQNPDSEKQKSHVLFPMQIPAFSVYMCVCKWGDCGNRLGTRKGQRDGKKEALKRERATGYKRPESGKDVMKAGDMGGARGLGTREKRNITKKIFVSKLQNGI